MYMANDKCTKNLPKTFVDDTQTGEDSYPIGLYRRFCSPEQRGFTATTYARAGGNRRETEVDNRWIVPYSPSYNYFSSIYQCFELAN